MCDIMCLAAHQLKGDTWEIFRASQCNWLFSRSWHTGWHHLGFERAAATAAQTNEGNEETIYGSLIFKHMRQKVCKTHQPESVEEAQCPEICQELPVEPVPARLGCGQAQLNRAGNNDKDYVIRYFSDTHPDLLFNSWCLQSPARLLSRWSEGFELELPN